MRTNAQFIVALAALVLSAAGPVHADIAPPPRVAAFTLTGQVQNTLRVGLDDLRAMPATEVSVTYVTGRGEEAGTFSGVKLWALLQQAVPVDDQRKGALLRHVITVTGRDGYAVVLAAGELAPDFENKPVILATAKDGEPLGEGEGIRLIVPGDKHGGRAVHDVVTIEVMVPRWYLISS